ncbi:hypothetical protein H2198_001126 [Neophaeococcomyces mojaviensis]|uniref:Uncharacterized protein n=1 Tax=Neophaeococcomyces mojaviensis TaxID=3383035 RepID=A0ACC3AIF2_9EURO|nr:hypothetical protein H2198_001126 [Knufia sp. JES_112]
MKTRSQPFRQQKKQSRLSFQPLPTSSPVKGEYSPAVQDRLANVRYGGSKLTPKRITRSTTHDDVEALPTPEPSSQPQGLPLSSSPLSDAPSTPSADRQASHIAALVAEEQDEDDVVLPSSKRRKFSPRVEDETPTRKSFRLRNLVTPNSDAVESRPTGRLNRVAASSPTRKALSIGSAESSGDEQDAIVTIPVARRRSTKKVEDDPFVIPDDDVVDHRTVSRSGARAMGGRQSRNVENDFVVDDDEVDYVSSDGDEAPARRRRNSFKKKRQRSRQEQDELDDDLKDLQDSNDEEPLAAGRTRGGPVTTQRDWNRQHLEVLKRRRAGERTLRVTDSDDEDGQHSDDDEDGVDLDEIVYSRPSRVPQIIEDDESGTEDEEQEEAPEQLEAEDEDDFVVDDESQAFADHHSSIPLAFTSFASSKPRELFVHIIEWLVKNRIAPAFNRDDELYVLSWNKVNDQIKAQAGSRLISSAWSENFKNAILARPQMQVNHVSEGDDEFFLNCDACNKTNHPARYEFKFAGHAYHKDTLEPIDEDADSDIDEEDDEEGDDEANDKASYDQQGHLLPSTHKTFNLGRFCAANAEMGHKLTHWKYHLNESLLAYLEEQGVLSVEAIVAREKLNKKKREKEAESIVDQMQETGIIEEMWRGLQDDLEDARFGMEDHIAKGGRRNKNRIGKVRINRGNGRIEEWSEGGRVKLLMPSDSEGE